MNVNVVGGGPGGAFTSLLLKKHDPSWDVTVFERYPPSTTYGWAIVLPEKTYSILREADEPMCERIQDATVRWDPIDTLHQGERVRCGSHPEDAGLVVTDPVAVSPAGRIRPGTPGLYESNHAGA